MRILKPHQIDQIQPMMRGASKNYRIPIINPLEVAGPLPQMHALHIVPTPGRNIFRIKRITAQNLFVDLTTVEYSVK